MPHRYGRLATWMASPWMHVAVIGVVAAVFRLWQIGSTPPGLFGDEAAEGLDALDVLAGRGRVFFPSNYGREGLYIWLVALSVRLFGVTPFAVRLPAIIIGTLTCVVAWWLARELAAQNRPGAAVRSAGVPLPALLPLITGLYLATAYWHVHFSRFSQRTILTPFFIGLTAAAFWRGVNQGRTRWFVAAGISLGLTLHTYSVGRFFPVLLALFLVAQWLVMPRPRAGEPERRILARHRRDIAWMLVLAAVVFAPLGFYYITHPGSFMQRASVVATYSGGDLADTFKLISRSALSNLAQYILPDGGDRAQFHNLPGRPIFEPLTAVLALLGLLHILRRWREPAPLFLLLWLAVLTLPAALATDRFPTLPRVLGVLPGLYLFPAVGLGAVVLWAARWADAILIHRRPIIPPRAVLGLLCALVLVVPAATTYRDYFRIWGPSAATYDAFEGDMAAAWRWLDEHTPGGHVYLSSDIYRHPTFMLLWEKASVTEYFAHTNPQLSWFDARRALPLPPDGRPATYLIGASAPLSELAEKMLAGPAVDRDQILDPDNRPALTVLELPVQAPLELPVATSGSGIVFSEQLTLLGARWVTSPEDDPLLVLVWRTAGPVAADWGGYRLEVVVGDAIADAPFDAFRGPEWIAGGRFVTWHRLDVAEPKSDVRARLLRVEDGRPLARPDAPDGWQGITVW